MAGGRTASVTRVFACSLGRQSACVAVSRMSVSRLKVHILIAMVGWRAIGRPTDQKKNDWLSRAARPLV